MLRVHKIGSGRLSTLNPQLSTSRACPLNLLRIKNLALVEDLEWQSQPGFTAITGETGAGKSIIIGALQLLLGERTDKSLIRTGAEFCTVEAVFAGEELAKLNAPLEEAGVEPCDGELILKRTFSTSRRKPPVHQRIAHDARRAEESRRRARRSPRTARSPIAPLARAAAALLDAFAACRCGLAEYQEHFRHFQTLIAEHLALSTAESAREQELDLLRHQVNEIAAANLDPGEEEEIGTRYKLASNSKRLIELASAIARRLSEADDAIVTQLAETQKLLRELEKIDPEMGAPGGRARCLRDRTVGDRARHDRLR